MQAVKAKSGSINIEAVKRNNKEEVDREIKIISEYLISQFSALQPLEKPLDSSRMMASNKLELAYDTKMAMGASPKNDSVQKLTQRIQRRKQFSPIEERDLEHTSTIYDHAN